MKRNYFKPEMNISTFSSEDVVTTSGNPITGTTGTAEDYNSASEGSKTTIAYDSFGFTF